MKKIGITLFTFLFSLFVILEMLLVSFNSKYFTLAVLLYE